MGQRGKKYKRFLIAKKEQQTCSLGEHNTRNAFPAGLKQWFADENISRSTAPITNNEIVMLVIGYNGRHDRERYSFINASHTKNYFYLWSSYPVASPC